MRGICSYDPIGQVQGLRISDQALIAERSLKGT